MNEAPRQSAGVPRTCSIIGSFRKHYEEAAAAGRALEAAGIELLSPRRTGIVDPDELFVRLRTDDPEHSSVQIQLIALHRILRSDLVYVVCPEGYLGRTTAYEIGRIVEWQLPLFFSTAPRDLPIPIAPEAVIPASELSSRLRLGRGLPALAPIADSAEVNRLHDALLKRECLPEEELR